VTLQPFAAAPGPLGLLATTGAAGFALVNGTPNILTWTAPNDGGIHRVLLMATLKVAVTEVGGAISVSFTTPDNTPFTAVAVAGAAGVGLALITAFGNAFLPVRAGTTVTVAQFSPLTLGAATLWAELWGS